MTTSNLSYSKMVLVLLQKLVLEGHKECYRQLRVIVKVRLFYPFRYLQVNLVEEEGK